MDPMDVKMTKPKKLIMKQFLLNDPAKRKVDEPNWSNQRLRSYKAQPGMSHMAPIRLGMSLMAP